MITAPAHSQLYKACDIEILTSDYRGIYHLTSNRLFDPSHPRCYLLIHYMLRVQQIVAFMN
jgi:hypothetical protein